MAITIGRANNTFTPTSEKILASSLFVENITAIALVLMQIIFIRIEYNTTERYLLSRRLRVIQKLYAG